ncbi:MAG: hypothetical protein QOH06_5485 [Acidobacteriota bacterium]|jgi:hypothetical protein|nr:hypothetical protein [Acidobacteriota bacterium]
MRRPTLFHMLAVACLAMVLASPARAGLNRWSGFGSTEQHGAPSGRP